MDPLARYELSPYCVFWLGQDGRTLHLVHGTHGTRFELSSSLLPMIAALAAGEPMETARASMPAVEDDVFKTLIAEEILVPARATSAPAEAPFHNRLDALELAFHRQVNEGGYFPDRVMGLPPEPGRSPTSAGFALALDDEVGMDPGFVQSLEARRTVRRFSRRELASSTLARFLAVAARARALRETPSLGWVSTRNYPSAGARYPLEIYAVIQGVDGVPEGIYHYHPFAHRLEPVQGDADVRAQLVAMAMHRLGAEASGHPAALLVITAVFARTCWKYRGMPYQAILMETGALYQTMSMTANALGLAGCPVGAFPEIAVASVLGLDSLDESPVGMFLLGTPEEASAAAQTIVAVRTGEDSLFGTDRGSILEITFEDGTRMVAPASELDLRHAASGGVTCGLAGRGVHPVEDEACIAALSRLLGRARGGG